MNTVEHHRTLFEYNDWANRRVAVAIKENRCNEALRIFAHLLTTEQEYFDRLHGKDSTGFDFWPAVTIEECGGLARQASERYEKLLKRFDDEGLDLYLRYKTSAGKEQQNNFREMLTHVLLHSATHRGNIVHAMRQEGFEPPVIDYIIFLRETKYL
jgi:uncharacterized damage-inducible protein DinB